MHMMYAAKRGTLSVSVRKRSGTQNWRGMAVARAQKESRAEGGSLTVPDVIGAIIKRGFKADEGKEIFGGVFSRDVQLPTKSDGTRMTFEEYRTNKASESKKLREEAARDLVNISANERERRKRIGQVLAVVTVGAATYLLATGAGPTTRLVIFPLFFFSFGYLQSARQGLCNIGNGNMWDVDGLGLSVIQDSELASKIRDKVNDMNVKGLLISAAVTGAFVALPALPQ